jgi:hypothetical protein
MKIIALLVIITLSIIFPPLIVVWLLVWALLKLSQ